MQQTKYRLINSGKVRDIYQGKNKSNIVVVASDRVSAFDKKLGIEIPDKGKILTAISAFWSVLVEDKEQNIGMTAYLSSNADCLDCIHPHGQVLKDYVFLSSILQLLCIRPETYAIQKTYVTNQEPYMGKLSVTECKNMAFLEIRESLLRIEQDITDEEVKEVVEQVVSRCPAFNNTK